MNQYVVVKTQQIAIEANDPDEALRNALSGQGTTAGVSYNVQLRPQAQAAARPGIQTVNPVTGQKSA